MSHSNRRPGDSFSNSNFRSATGTPDEILETNRIPEHRSETNTEQPLQSHPEDIVLSSSRHRRQPSLSSTQESSSLFCLDLQTSTGRKKSNKPRPTLARLNISAPPKVYSGARDSSTSTDFCGSPTSDLSTSGETEEKSILKYNTECNSQLSAHLFEISRENVSSFASQSPTTPRRNVRFNLPIPRLPPDPQLNDKPRRKFQVPDPIDTSRAGFDLQKSSQSTDLAPQSTSFDLIEQFPKVPVTTLNHGVGSWGSNSRSASNARPGSSPYNNAMSTLIPAPYRPGCHLFHAGRGRSGVPASTSTFFPSPEFTPQFNDDDSPSRSENGSNDQVFKDEQTSLSPSLSFSSSFNIPGMPRAKSTSGMDQAENQKGKEVQRRSVGFNPQSTSSDPAPPSLARLPPTPPTELPASPPTSDLAFLPIPPSSLEQRSPRHLSRYALSRDLRDLFDDFDEFNEERDIPDTAGERRRKMSAGSLLAEALNAGQTPAFFGLGRSPLYPEQQSPALYALRTAPQPSSPTLHEDPYSSTSRPRPLSARVYNEPFTFPSEQDLPFSPLKSQTMAPPSPIARPSGHAECSVPSSTVCEPPRSSRFCPTQVSPSPPPQHYASTSSISEPSHSPTLYSTSVHDTDSRPNRPAKGSKHPVQEHPANPFSDNIHQGVRSSSCSAPRRSEPTLSPPQLSTPVTRSSSSVSHKRNHRAFPRISPLPLPGKSPLSLFSTSPGINKSLLDPKLHQTRSPFRPNSPIRSTSPIRRSVSFTRSAPLPRPNSPTKSNSPTRPSASARSTSPTRSISPTRPVSPTHSSSILDRGRPRSYQPTDSSPSPRPVVIRQPRRVTSLRCERSSRGQGSARVDEGELAPIFPTSELTLLQALSSSPTPGSAGSRTQRPRPVTAPCPGASTSSLSVTMSYDALVNSTFAFQPLEPLVSFATAVPGVRVSTAPEIYQGTQTAQWSMTHRGTSASPSPSMSLAARWRRTFSPTRSALPLETTGSLGARRKGKSKAERDQDAPSASPSVLGKQIAKLSQFFSKSKGKKDKEKDEKGKGKDKGEDKKKHRPASTPAAFAFLPAIERPYRDSQEEEVEDDEEEEGDKGRDVQPGPSRTVGGNEGCRPGADDKFEMLVEATDLDHIDTPIARRFL